jgi:hypothetical protein
MYLPQSLIILRPIKIPRIIAQVSLVLLFIFQLYQTQFNSFVADYRTSVRSRDLKSFAHNIPLDKSLFVYQAPELVPFLKNVQYYQYMDVTTSINVGEKYLPVLSKGIADLVFVNRDIYKAQPELFVRYGNGRDVDRYIALSLLK